MTTTTPQTLLATLLRRGLRRSVVISGMLMLLPLGTTVAQPHGGAMQWAPPPGAMPPATTWPYPPPPRGAIYRAYPHPGAPFQPYFGVPQGGPPQAAFPGLPLPSPGGFFNCWCVDKTDLDRDGNKTEMRRCAILPNGWNEIANGCEPTDETTPGHTGDLGIQQP